MRGTTSLKVGGHYLINRKEAISYKGMGSLSHNRGEVTISLRGDLYLSGGGVKVDLSKDCIGIGQ